MKILHKLTIIIVILISLAIVVWETVDVGANMGTPSKVIGSDNKGVVTKVVYSNSSNSSAKIAVITGMHPREILAKNVVPGVVKSYTQKNNVEIVNYKINVTAYPENFYTGRNNGEYLVAKYVIPDIKKSDYNLVIVCHDHEEGYGEGYYIATPSMDAKSIALGQKIRNNLTDFNFCLRDVTKKVESRSIETVNDPIVATGTPLIVYEIPEWLDKSDVAHNTNRLLESVFKSI
jgi:hypothetical protein